MNVLILTGAGVSAESGIPTFRDANGLWEGHSIEDVATPRGFARNPKLVHEFYNQRRRLLLSDTIRPNAAHHALAQFERRHLEQKCGQFLLVTQNIDDLHQRAGSQNVLPMHGELLKVRCCYTEQIYNWREDLSEQTPHPDDPTNESMRGSLRPHVVWFGEMPLGLSQIEQAAQQADVFVAIGTSGLVYPAAGIVAQTSATCRRIEINLDATPTSSQFDQTLRGKASELVPQWLDELSQLIHSAG
jgi:NAD-dependent deacetylase